MVESGDAARRIQSLKYKRGGPERRIIPEYIWKKLFGDLWVVSWTETSFFECGDQFRESLGPSVCGFGRTDEDEFGSLGEGTGGRT